MTEHDADNPGRRRLLGSAAAGAAGVAVGFASGTWRGASSRMAPQVRVEGRRRFEGKVVLITGATSGIGRAAAVAFAAEGARVAFCGRRVQLGQQVEQAIRQAGGEARYIPADVRVERDVQAFVEAAVKAYGRLDVAFNNAGITLEKPLHTYTAQEWDDVVHTDLRGVFLAMKYEIPHMLAGGGGNIVVTSSSNAIATKPRHAAYSAAKHGLIGLVQAAALDYAQLGIRVNALLPGTTDTALVRRIAGMENVPDTAWAIAAGQWSQSHVPMGRMASAEEIAAFALTLASDEHPYMTGASMVIDGGKTARTG